jgi:prophage regulatory protein
MKILRWKILHERVQLGRTTVWRLERQGLFPRRIKIGPNSVGWRENEVDEWMKSRPVVA